MSHPSNVPQAGTATRAPRRVGRYDIVLPIASGGMATVYLARPAAASQEVAPRFALKLTHAHLRQHQEFSRQLVEEAKIAAGIEHPNVVPVLDVGDDAQGIYLVMEYVDGDTLGNLHRLAHKAGGPLPVGVGLRVLLDALAGLHAAHELVDAAGRHLSLVHRDFTPQNILVGLDGMARLTDFGIAKAATSLDQTATGIVKGKIAYMSPEQARGRKLDRRADVFSAGVVAWELVAGRRLHDADTDVTLLLKVASEQAPRLATVRRDTPPALDAAVASALELDREMRCPSAAEFANRLRAAVEPVGWLASREQVAEELNRILGPKLARRHDRIRRSLAGRGAGSPSPHATPWPDSTPFPVDQPLQSDPSVRSFSHPGVQMPARAGEEAGLDAAGAASRPEPRRFPVRLGAAIALGGVGAIAVILPILVVGLETQPTPSEPATDAPSAPSAPIAPASSPAATASSVPTPFTVPIASAEAPARTVEVRANAKITALVIGGRNVRVETPGVSIVANLDPDRDDRAQRVHATSIDGRRAHGYLQSGQSRLTLHFGPRPSDTTAPAKTAPASSLAPNPYGR